jgi:hypothetical protein
MGFFATSLSGSLAMRAPAESRRMEVRRIKNLDGKVKGRLAGWWMETMMDFREMAIRGWLRFWVKAKQELICRREREKLTA